MNPVFDSSGKGSWFRFSGFGFRVSGSGSPRKHAKSQQFATSLARASGQFNIETLIIYKLDSRKFTTQNDFY